MKYRLIKLPIIISCLLFACLFLKTEAINKQSASTENLRVQWMKRKYGLMVHWLAPGPPPQKGEQIKDLNKAVDNFDLKGFMDDFDKTGAEWLIFTIGQNSGFYASPNSVIDSLAGVGHTPRRDLVLEIAKELKKRGKRFIAYLPCEIRENKSLHKGFSWNTQEGTDQAAFQEKYLRVVREWAVRYGEYLDGWWIDGCYTWGIFHNKYVMWDKWFDACRAGNRNAVVSFNDGSYCTNNTKPTVPMLDYISGETEVLINGKIRLSRDSQSQLFMPEQAYVPETHCLYHALVPIDALWAHGNGWQNFVNAPFTTIAPKNQEDMEPPVYSDSDLIQFVNDFTKVGGAVTLNVGIFQEGGLGLETIKQLKKLKKSRKTN